MKLCSHLSFLFLSTLIVSCAHNAHEIKNYQILNTKIYTLKNAPIVGTTFANQKIPLGGLSGLIFDSKENNEFIFKSITDRGPNGWQINLDRPFLVPDFSPEIVTLKTDTSKNEIIVTHELKLKKKNGTLATGLPNHRNEENPIDVFGLMYSIDSEGVDTESLVPDGEGGFWIGEEYAPSLIHVNADGKMIRRLMPNAELPRVYSERKTNRGFEGIARIENKLFGILQSPIPVDKNFNRIVEFDLDSYRTSAEYFYQLDEKSDRVGDMYALPDHSLIVIEQNGKKGEESYKRIYRVRISKSDELLKKELIANLDLTPFKEHEKVEGLTAIDDRHIALVNDNDFTITGKTDFKTGLTPLEEIKSQLMIIELDQDL